MKFECDLFVIGGGSGGVRAARLASNLGYKVYLAEGDRLGGTCVIRGCVPKKLMVFASNFKESLKEASLYGWDVNFKKFDWTLFKTNLDNELNRLEDVYRGLLLSSGVVVFDSWAKIKDPHTVILVDGQEVLAKHILIATGGIPIRPEISNASIGMISDDVFQMERLPQSILIVGGGYIASEFSGIFNGLGVKVTQSYRGNQILRGFDNEARTLVSETMVKKGVKLELNSKVLKIKKEGESIKVGMSDGSERLFDSLLFATGRSPNTRSLGLENVEVNIGDRGNILVNEYSQTTVPSIFAIGDVTDRINLTPVAIREAVSFVETVFNATPTPVDHEVIPSAVFTQPELGSVGLSEETALSLEPIRVYSSKFKPMKQSFIGVNEHVLMKLVVSERTDKVLGCHIVAREAGEMIQLASIAIKMGATKRQFDQVCAVHPTMAEELVTMKTPTRRG